MKNYVIVPEAMDFRKISKLMAKAGWQMNHATVRSLVLESMEKVIRNTSKKMGHPISDQKIEELLESKEFHISFADLVYGIFRKDCTYGENHEEQA